VSVTQVIFLKIAPVCN